MSQGRPNCVLMLRLHSDVLGTSPGRQFYEVHYCCIIFYPTHQMCCVKYWKVSCCLFLRLWRNILQKSSKCLKKMSVGWRPREVPRTLILNLSYKCIFTALFSILFLQMCVRNTKELFYSFRFLEKLPKDVL